MTRFDAEVWVCDVQESIIAFGGGAGSGGSTTNSAPWEGQQPYLTSTFGAAQNLYNSYTPQYFGTVNGDGSTVGESTVAPMNAQETGAIDQIGQLGQGTPGLTAAANTATNIAGTNPANNPGNSALTNYANGSMLSAQNPYFQSMANQVQTSMLPGLMSSFTQGSTDNPNVAFAASQGLGNALGGLAYQNYAQNEQNQITAGQQLSNNYNTGISNQLNAANLGSNIYGQQLAGANSSLTAGQAAQTQAQNELSNNVNMFNYYQQLPYEQLNNYANLVNGQYGQSTTSTSPAQALWQELF